jgi:hypothetical protein
VIIYGLGRDSICLERTVLVMPSVKRTNSIVSRDVAHSGNKATTKSRALRWESALSYDKPMSRISGAMVGSGGGYDSKTVEERQIGGLRRGGFCKAKTGHDRKRRTGVRTKDVGPRT